MAGLFEGLTRIHVRAVTLGERLELKQLDAGPKLGLAPLVVAEPSGGCVVLFRYGVAVLFQVPDEQAALARLRPVVVEPYPEKDHEDEDVALDPDGAERVEDGVVWLRDFSIERLQLVASVLARSIVLAHYEARIAHEFDRIEPLARDLVRAGTAGWRARALVSHIGGALLIQHRMVGRAQVGEKPDLLWEHPELERVYLRLADEYEIDEREQGLERQLELISRTATTLLELLQSRRALRVEWYIVGLILFEIALTPYDMFLR